ncbi:hypothetical protein T459_23452 [Capsicum annuum]|uniref:Uncharacterized protein n=1 Tax=Capsicum annuum TaxID=4072 RepID=A0A2G2YSC9_CAPAN|nr:hypothetical protein T459_23452 [Capsicum annuum]
MFVENLAGHQLRRGCDELECFPMEVPQLLSSSLQKLIITCLTEGDDRDPSKAAVKASSSALLARILVMNTNYLAQLTSDPSLFTHLQKSGFPGEENILLCLVDVWLEKVQICEPPVEHSVVEGA